MLKAINTKILLAILSALTAIGGALTYQRHEAAKAAAVAARAAAILQQQQKEAEERRDEDEAFAPPSVTVSICDGPSVNAELRPWESDPLASRLLKN
jgi:Flp pilus assembly protein TadG